ncbi:isovaleryl-CoA dehydrogenase [Aquisalimonas asiatica]|uniref:Putative acyl-CoA dehydrogenase n=1 Tax=Aquisalimonas asiatica TaxID=406100 RepID=A0A1H8QC21_9GAMM|nr:isovaleryl-CoA dehydrogenase [Aquisalimonas asiatica]SEO51477.1 putative acyl-CoA dehydrogenase [Aquisalimonas asiatica]
MAANNAHNLPTATLWKTHDVTNQPPPFEGRNLYAADTVLRDAVHREGGSWGEDQLHQYGERVGGALWEAGFDANRNPPELHTHDRYGHRVDQVTFHPAYHQLMDAAIGNGLHALSWDQDGVGAQVVRSALMYLHNQAESGTMCPVTMTHAAVPALRHQPDVARIWEPRILSRQYDARFLPPEQKTGVTLGMGMTEKQGGSDVRANTTQAIPVGAEGPGRDYELIGHKWFFSAPMSDAFLVLAQSRGGLSCFLLPRWCPDGSVNAIRIQRLKDKLGNRSNASSEVEFLNAHAVMVGEEGRGVATIIDMVAQTRLDCMIGSGSLMRHGLAHAMHHCAHRKAFGSTLLKQPLMRNVLADLALEVEGATALTFRVAAALDRQQDDPAEAAFARIATALGKYWICKRAAGHITEAQECLGGAGYVEEHVLPRLYREAPVNAIWEGSGNIQCLDVLRAMQKSPETVQVVMDELRQARGENRHLDAAIQRIESRLGGNAELPMEARVLVEDLVLALQGGLLVRAGRQAVADAFCAARLGPERTLLYGGLPDGLDTDIILTRASPQEA